MEFNRSRTQEFIDHTIQAEGRRPRYYVPVGSHMYGYSNNDSDVDLMGFHTVDADEYSYLYEPEAVVEINIKDNEYPQYSGLEVRSYELKKFVQLILETNYGAIEAILCGNPVVNGPTLEVESLRQIIRDYLPLNVPHTYRGMAKSNYHSNLDRDNVDKYEPLPKNFIHVYRGLMASLYVEKNEELIADVVKLSQQLDSADEDMVSELIDRRGQEIDGEFENRVHSEIIEMFNEVHLSSYEDKSEFKDELDSWTRQFRN